RLLAIDLLGPRDVEAPEVDQLARRVDLRLVRRLRLAEHRRGIQDHPVWSGQEIGRLQKDRRTVLPRQARPFAVGGAGRVDRALNLGSAGLVPDGEDVTVVVRHDRVRGPAGRDPAPADARRDLDDLAGHPVELGPERLALLTTGGVSEDGLVAGNGHAEDPVAHRGPPGRRYRRPAPAGALSRSSRSRPRAPVAAIASAE